MRSFFLKAKRIIGHNIQRWDIPTVERILGIFPTAQVIDTLALSWYLEPSRKKHGLEEWGEFFGVQKPPVDDWENQLTSVYIHRCEQDVKINTKLWERFHKKLIQIYGDKDKILDLLNYLEFKMQCARAQEESGWKLDIDKCKKSLQELETIKEEKIQQLIPVMPKVPIYKVRTIPKVMYKKDGSLSKHGQSWNEFLIEYGLPDDTQEHKYVADYEDGNPNSHDQLKEWLFSLGWVPDEYKTVKDKNTGESREVPQINKKPQDGGGVTESVKRLYDKEPNLEAVDGLFILGHRIGILSGFLRDVDSKGYLRARIKGFTNTLRVQHAEIVNLPRVDRPYAEAVRGSLTCEDDEILVGSDLSSLEDRLKQHFIYPFDPDYVNEMMSEDYDPHLSLALSAEAVTEEQVRLYKEGTDKSIKPIRDVYKNGNYACQYNAYPPRLAITCGITLDKAKELFDAYWDKNKAIKQAVEQLKIKYIEVDGKEEMWQYNPVSGLYYSLRKKNDQFSTLVQGTAAYVFDLFLGFVLQKSPTLIAQFHDEWVKRCKIGNEKQENKIAMWAIQKVNNHLKLNRELDIGVQTGKYYSDIH